MLWPAGLADDLKVVVSSDYAALAVYDNIANATTVEQITGSVFPDNGFGEAAQRIRAHLELPADTVASCVGHTG